MARRIQPIEFQIDRHLGAAKRPCDVTGCIHCVKPVGQILMKYGEQHEQRKGKKESVGKY